MAKKKPLGPDATMRKLAVEYLIPGMIAVDLGHIEFLKKMSERLKAEIRKEERRGKE